MTADNKYALVVNGYEITEDEESSIVTNVTFPQPSRMMEELTTRVMFGSAVFFACLGLQEINQVVSLIVGCATMVFLALSIIKLLKEFNEKDSQK